MDWLGDWFDGRKTLFLLLVTVPVVARCQPPIQQVANVSDPPQESPHPIDRALQYARASLQLVQSDMEDYTALFVKRCRVAGVLPPLQYAELKIRNRKINDTGQVVSPLSVYLKFLQPSDVKGREIIWVEGRDQNQLVVHQGSGLARFVTVRLDPTGYLAMRGQRYPISEIGIENLLEKIIETGQRDRQHDECQVQFYQNAKIGDEACTMLEVIHPVRRAHFDFHRARIYFSNTHKVPIRYESWTWPAAPGGEPVLQEEYNYLKLRVNVGLSAQDFDVNNPAYQFQ